MKKTYSQFTSEALSEQLGIQVIQDYLFQTSALQEPSLWLLETLNMNQEVPMTSEKARSELLITPILIELRQKNPHIFTYFSGCLFDIDKQRGLKGFCDFIISKRWNAVFLESPVAALVEAKHNQALLDAVPQCGAEMYAAQIFNQRKGQEIPIIYGAVTNGYEWQFLTLEENTLRVDIKCYTLHNLPELLGVWQVIIDGFK